MSSENVSKRSRILVSDKIFNAPVISIHCSNAQNVGFENPTYAKQAVACIHTDRVRDCATHSTCESHETSKPMRRVCAVRTHAVA